MLKLTFHGHSCWEFYDGMHRVLIDPFLTGNPLAEVSPDAFTKLDAIVISHGHGDHIGAAVAIPMHYDTFDWTKADANEFVKQVAAGGRKAVIVKPGASYSA